MVSFTPWPIYPREKSLRYPLDRTLGVPQNRSGLLGEEKILDSTGTHAHDLSVAQPVVSRCTDYAIPAPPNMKGNVKYNSLLKFLDKKIILYAV
jgi:hypothetical protein